MTKADLNLAVIQNFILHITHSSIPHDRVNGEDEYAEVPMTFTPDKLYELAEQYIEEDHVDGRDEPSNNIEIVQKSYEQECLEELKEGGFNTTNVTPEQAQVILEPSHAPENFYCDGELSHAQGLENWKDKMKRAGLTPLQRVKAEQYIFG